MALISLQLFSGQLIDVDTSTDFSLKSENPFFCVGITELAHTQDFSVPATQNNNRIFNVDNSVIMEGWRRGRDCWLGYSAGEIAGRLFIKDYNKGRYNLLFIWGAEIMDILNQPIADYVTTGLSLNITAYPTLKYSVNDFGWCNYSEAHSDISFSDGVSLLPVVNLGWLMDTAAASAGYSITMDGVHMQNVSLDQYNAYKYGINIDSLNVGDTYTLALSGWCASGINASNFQLFDHNNNPVPLSSAGLAWRNFQLPTNQPNVPALGIIFYATRNIRLKLASDPNVICLIIDGVMVGHPEGNGGQVPNIEFNTVLSLNAGQGFTFLHVNDFDYDTWKPKYNGYTTTINYNCNIIDSVTVATVGHVLYLDENLPAYSLLELVRNWCLMTSSFFVIDEENKVINILSIESVIAGRFSNNITNINQNRNILDIAELRRYIDGLSQHNNIVCQSADYVAEINRYRADYTCNNDLLDNESEFGIITFNDGNITGDGEASFDNFQPRDGGGINLKPSVGVFMFNYDGGFSRHLSWVEGNYGMHNAMAAITAEAVTIEITVRETIAQYLSHQYDELFSYDGCMWVSKSYTWKDNATQMTLVKVDNAMALAFQEPHQLRFYAESANATLYVTSDSADIEYSMDGGSTWAVLDCGNWTHDTLTLSNAGDYVLLRGHNSSLGPNHTHITLSGIDKITGDINCLLNGHGGDIDLPTACFSELFSNNNSLMDISGLQFPSTKAGAAAYQAMFNYCGNLQGNVTIDCVTADAYTFYLMFSHTLINDLTVSVANDSIPSAFVLWLAGAVASGVIRCPQSLTLHTDSESGVPIGWTRVNL